MSIRELKGISVALVIGLSVWGCSSSVGADWPAYRHDAQRTAVTDEKLSFPLSLAWRYTCAQPPASAWRPTSKYFNRLDFDYAPQPVAAAGIVVFGSSSDDTIRALDAATGIEKWHYITGGPIRFAPYIAAGRVYAVSDDGFVYCLDAVTGKEIWTFRAAPNNDRLLGDTRMISRWPLRCGLLVDGGVVYTVAGMWPAEGIFIYALDAATGKVIWCNDTSGAISPGEGGIVGWRTYFLGNFIGLAPQGVMLAGRNELVIPQGRANPARVNRRTGELSKFGGALKGVNSTAPPFTMAGEWPVVYTDLGNTKRDGKTAIIQTVIGTGYTNLPQPSLGEEGMANPEKGMDVALLATQERLYARQGYSIALADETLVVGEDGAVAACEAKQTSPSVKRGRLAVPARYDAATQRELWRAPVNGQARGLAVANGRVFVTTDRGEVYCFAAEGKKAPAGSQESVVSSQKATSAINNEQLTTINLLHSAGMDRGYALIIGDPDGSLAVGLAEQTALHIISVAADAGAARILRERLLATTALYGSRIHVFAPAADGRLPFAQFFANAVIVAGETGVPPATELYRLLRPVGGVLLCPGLTPSAASALLRSSGASAGEIVADGQPRIVRGPLAGALDWNSRDKTDRRLRAPLRPLWFGGPAPMNAIARGLNSGTADLIAAHGRFFHLLDGELVAIDAYNGRELWRRRVPHELRPLLVDGEQRLVETPPFDRIGDSPFWQWHKAPRAERGFAADAESVYLTLGETCFRGAGVTCVKFNAANGDVKALYGPVARSPEVSLCTPQTWTIRIDAEHEGRIELSADAAGLVAELTTRDPVVTRKDSWSLYFDFRPAAERYGLYGAGTFEVHIQPAVDSQTPAQWRKGHGASVPAFSVSGRRTADGTVTTVKLAWADLVAATGSKPKTFGFAAALRNDDGARPKGKTKQAGLAKEEAYLFGDPMADALNNGWATVILEEAPADLAALKKPAIVAGPLEKVPAEFRRLPDAKAYYRPDPEAAKSTRAYPFTGERVPKTYDSGNGCGLSYSSAYVHYMRSGTLGYYDLLDDSGIRHFAGIRTSCGMNMLAALGVLFVSEDDSGCGCLYSFQIPFALANAEKRLNEDWATFTDRPVEGLVRMAAINLGAPGDRRDDGGTLWLNYPRFLTRRSGNFVVPLAVEASKELGPYRVNADRVAIRNTDRPWIYTSQYRGLTKATLTLDFRKPPATAARPFTVRLHFAELDDGAKPGQRVFDVNLQGQTVLRGFDVVKEAGGARTALVKEFKGVRATGALTVEFVPAAKEMTAANAPILCALEAMEEGFVPPAGARAK